MGNKFGKRTIKEKYKTSEQFYKQSEAGYSCKATRLSDEKPVVVKLYSLPGLSKEQKKEVYQDMK